MEPRVPESRKRDGSRPGCVVSQRRLGECSYVFVAFLDEVLLVRSSLGTKLSPLFKTVSETPLLNGLT